VQGAGFRVIEASQCHLWSREEDARHMGRRIYIICHGSRFRYLGQATTTDTNATHTNTHKHTHTNTHTHKPGAGREDRNPCQVLASARHTSSSQTRRFVGLLPAAATRTKFCLALVMRGRCLHVHVTARRGMKGGREGGRERAGEGGMGREEEGKKRRERERGVCAERRKFVCVCVLQRHRHRPITKKQTHIQKQTRTQT
jgi:hypothetical protein